MPEGGNGRGEAALREELSRRASAVFGARGDAFAPGEIMAAILGAAARIGEEVTRLLAQAPQKQAVNFYAAMGVGRAPATPAKLPVSIATGSLGAEPLFVPAGAKFQAEAGGAPVIFQTMTGLDLARGAIVRLCAVDLTEDKIFIAPDAALSPALPPVGVLERRLASGVGPGATRLQIEPATGLAPGALLRIGGPGRAAEHTAAKVDGDLVAVAPPLAATFQMGDPVVEVTGFSPWSDSARDHQAHRLYLGHATLLDIPSAATILVYGLGGDVSFEWRWFGKSEGAEAADWLAFDKAEIDADGRWRLVKPKGKSAKTDVGETSMFWLRVTAKDASQGARAGQSIRLAVASETGAQDFEGADYEAVAVTTPMVVGAPFHPFGREPRLYDSFYIGCREALGKAGANVRLRFTLGGGTLGPMAKLEVGDAPQVFAVGRDGLLYRAIFTYRGPVFVVAPLPPEIRSVGFSPQGAVATRLDKFEAKIAVAGRDGVYATTFGAFDKLTEGRIAWRKLTLPESGGEVVTLHVASADRVLALWRKPSTTLDAAAETPLVLDWRLSSGNKPGVIENAIDLIPLQGNGTDAALLIEQGDKPDALYLSPISGDQTTSEVVLEVEAAVIPETMRAAWVSSDDTLVIGGYAKEGGETRALQLVRISIEKATPTVRSYGATTVVVAKPRDKLGAYPPLPIAFEPPSSEESWPVVAIATPVPTRIVIDDAGTPNVTNDDADIGFSANPWRHFLTVCGWRAVQHPDRGLFYRVSKIARVDAPSAPAPWIALGPNQPANPDLSWEYWNGAAWWTLKAPQLALFDTTADLQIDGEVSFVVPGDLAETDVGGRPNRWIRARLIGGDYGQARLLKSAESSDASLTRDLSAINAPYLIALKINYSALEPRPPEAIVTEDNLDAIDQTGANDAGLPVRYCAPVASMVDPPVSAAPKTPGDDGVCCEAWADPAPAPQPTAPSPLPPRLLLIGFDQPPAGDAVSLYADVEPAGSAAELAAFVFRRGAFTPVEIAADSSFGMSEPGFVQLRIGDPLDLAQLLGANAYWLALGPRGDAAAWRPRLRGLHPNAVLTASVESRGNESLGASTGAPDQRFRLAAAPVDPASLELWIAEPLGEEEARALGALDAIEGVPGPWAPWRQTPDWPAATQSPGGLYTLDPLAGELAFGDGRKALIPPMGAAILARAYRHVAGAAANGVAAGAELQPLSPLAGVDKILALDAARGGADAETTAAALARAPAKMRGGDSPITSADIEELVAARFDWVAQARAQNRRGRIRLVVVGRGARRIPLPSALRGVGEFIAQTGAFGVAARLDVVAPRLLPLTISAALTADAGADVATLAARARAAIVSFFDPQAGGHDGRGWPTGATPGAGDVAAALAAVAEDAVLRDIVVARRDNGAPLPPALPVDVLACVAEADVALLATAEAAP